MFLGEYEHSVDVKGRLAVPAKFRTQLEGGLVITRGFERCLQVYPMEQWQALSERVSSLPLGSAESRQTPLPDAAARRANAIGDTAVVAGMNTYFEIWSQTDWEAALAALDEDSEGAIAAQMAEIGI